MAIARCSFLYQPADSNPSTDSSSAPDNCKAALWSPAAGASLPCAPPCAA